jgi:hypothetical protein
MSAPKFYNEYVKIAIYKYREANKETIRPKQQGYNRKAYLRRKEDGIKQPPQMCHDCNVLCTNLYAHKHTKKHIKNKSLVVIDPLFDICDELN